MNGDIELSKFTIERYLKFITDKFPNFSIFPAYDKNTGKQSGWGFNPDTFRENTIIYADTFADLMFVLDRQICETNRRNSHG